MSMVPTVMAHMRHTEKKLDFFSMGTHELSTFVVRVEESCQVSRATPKYLVKTLINANLCISWAHIEIFKFEACPILAYFAYFAVKWANSHIFRQKRHFWRKIHGIAFLLLLMQVNMSSKGAK